MMKNILRSRTAALARKEVLHILRDPRSLLIIFMLPLLMMMIFGYAIDMDLKNIRLGALDYDMSPKSRDLLERLNASPNFEITRRLSRRSQIKEMILARRIRAAVVIPVGFGEDINQKTLTPVQVIVDGADANSASIIINFLQAFVADYSMDQSAAGIEPPLQVRHRIFYNPEMESVNFVVPGLIAIFLMMVCAMLTSVTIAREKETGTLEQILVSPIRRHEVILGKVIPYVALSFLVGSVILAFSYFWFKVPFLGSAALLAFLSLFYLFTALAFGLLISTAAPNQQMAMVTSLVSTILPAVMLSGFIFPIPSMPKVLQWLSYIIPARYFLLVIRGIMLKGIGFEVAWPWILPLAGLAIWFLFVAGRRFKLKLS
jgi:ABC-2 type transport system permease protein